MQEMPRKVALERLMQRSDLDGLEPHDALLLIGSIIDLGGDEKSVAALEHASGLLERYLAGEVPDRLACRAHYFRANIWSAKRYMSPDWESWVWKSDLINGEILELRRSVTHLGFIELSALEQAQILTNLGNILNHVGRFVEAIEYWDRALAAVPRFAMASGNRGIGLGHYANVVHDQGHGSVLLLSAWRALMAACDRDAILDSPVYGHAAQKHFGEYAASISARYDVASLARSFDFDNHPMGRGRRERAYRRWCLENRLFINPLNDVGPHPIAAQDVMMLPSITVGFGSHPGPPLRSSGTSTSSSRNSVAPATRSTRR